MDTGRNRGLELLRMVSMLLVLLLHILGQGGVLAAAEAGATASAAWLLESAAYCAVDCYALLSGYAAVLSQARPSRIARLWLQTAFYSLGVTALFFLLRPETRASAAAVSAVFPILTRQYWYITAYFALSFFLPYINRLLRALDRRALHRLALSVFLLFSVLPSLAGRDVFQLAGGYSFLWIAALYILGAWLRLTGAGERLSGAKALGLYALCVLAGWMAPRLLPGAAPGAFLSYVAPNVLVSAVCLLLAFARLRVPDAAMRLLSPLCDASLGVYLLHTQPMVWNYLLAGRFAALAALPAWGLVPAALAAAAGAYLLCAAVELLRQALFRLARLDALAARLDRIALLK